MGRRTSKDSDEQLGDKMPKTQALAKTGVKEFLRANPFPHPYTTGFYYREKMRAIYAVTPCDRFEKVLELGGGESGLSALLFPGSQIVNLDIDSKLGVSLLNRQRRVRFVCGDATLLPFQDEFFDAVTLFDVLEHVQQDKRAIAEVLRVLRPGGVILISAPNQNWRFPYYGLFKPICPKESTVMARWGHVRRGYSYQDLQRILGMRCEASSNFINPATVISHDVAFSKLPGPLRRVLCLLLLPITWLGYALHKDQTLGTETATSWRKALQRPLAK